MAQYCIVPAPQVFGLPETMSAEVSVFVEPVSCAIHGIDKANIQTGDTVVILGGGTIGLIMVQLAAHAGAARTIVVEPLPHKRAIAQRVGADLVLDPAGHDVTSSVVGLTGVGADVVIECVGKPSTMQLALALARRGGMVEFFGVCPIGETFPVEPNQIYFKELTIVGSYVNPHTFARSITLLETGKVTTEAFQIDRFPLDGVHEALARQKEGKTLKSIIQPNA
jgi:threonine dehydrogenase-like Zn-dependent dehydrogenase